MNTTRSRARSTKPDEAVSARYLSRTEAVVQVPIRVSGVDHWCSIQRISGEVRWVTVRGHGASKSIEQAIRSARDYLQCAPEEELAVEESVGDALEKTLVASVSLSGWRRELAS